MSSEAYLELFKIYDSAFFCKNSLPSLTYVSLRKKWPYSELFWSAFFPYFPAFDQYLSVFSPYVRKCQKNADQNNAEYGHFLRSVWL